MGIGGPVLRDSYHLGQTVYNDYGRPTRRASTTSPASPASMSTAASRCTSAASIQHAPAYDGYSLSLAQPALLHRRDLPFAPPNDPQDTIPYGSTNNAVNTFRLQEAYLAYHWWGHEISFGKSDSWLGTGHGRRHGVEQQRARTSTPSASTASSRCTFPALSKLLGTDPL